MNSPQETSGRTLEMDAPMQIKKIKALLQEASLRGAILPIPLYFIEEAPEQAVAYLVQMAAALKEKLETVVMFQPAPIVILQKDSAWSGLPHYNTCKMEG